MSRSTLHYFGLSGIDPLLKHLRDQFLPGEFFVHQSACFSRQGDADLMNLLYERMGTGKWFFTKYVLLARLEKAGFAVLTAYDGDEAMHALRRERPDLAVLDVQLPGRDGWEILRWLRGRVPGGAPRAHAHRARGRRVPA